jgi:hypothetical protein
VVGWTARCIPFISLLAHFFNLEIWVYAAGSPSNNPLDLDRLRFFDILVYTNAARVARKEGRELRPRRASCPRSQGGRCLHLRVAGPRGQGARHRTTPVHPLVLSLRSFPLLPPPARGYMHSPPLEPRPQRERCGGNPSSALRYCFFLPLGEEGPLLLLLVITTSSCSGNPQPTLCRSNMSSS